MSKVALIIIYNHQYNNNIAVLEKIYHNRFTNIYHLVPFYTGDLPNVISVYENSFYFQGYVTQGLSSFFDNQYDHYFFVADDLLLNPEINENNYTHFFKLKASTCFVPELISLHETDLNKRWERVADGFNYNIELDGVEAKNFLPDYNTALATFNKFGLSVGPLNFRQIWDAPKSLKNWFTMPRREVLRYLKNLIVKQQHRLRYPVVGGYSDVFIISADTIKQFSHYCGITAVTKLFVEVGLPTSLVLSAKEIVTEKDLNLKGFPLWTPQDYTILDKYNNNLNDLLNNFPDNLLYIHPIKLSKWKA
jgi:hypothetical protein